MDHLIRSPSHKRDSSSHKSMKHKLERLENTVSAIPQTLNEYLDAFSAFCVSGIKLASLLETLFQETPVLLVALRYREACERLSDKCNKSGLIIKQEVLPPVKKMAPSLSKLRSRLESHAKAVSKHESYSKQLESLQNSHNSNKQQKLDHLESKFHSSAEDFAKEDVQLAEALNDFYKMRVEVMGTCFLSFLEAQSKLLTSSSEIMNPLGAYKEVGKGLNDSPSNSLVKEATVGWLAAAQVNQNLRSFGNLTRNDVQCMMYNNNDGLPDTIQKGLNQKVDQLLKMYASELQQAPSPHHKVTGGFHLNSKGIELALRDCCSELEARGAGAPHVQTRADKVDQIERDVPRISYSVQNKIFGCAMGENVRANINEKTEAIRKQIMSLPLANSRDVSKESIDEFAFHVLNESCTTVTNTAAKTAVQLVFGKANLVFVRPSPSAEDNHPVEICSRSADSFILVTVQSSWWLVEDYAAFSMLSRMADPSALLGIVDVTYTINLSLQNFLKEDSIPELPSIAVTYRQPPECYSPPQQQRTNNVKDKDRLHTINRSIKALFHVGRGSSHTVSRDRDPPPPPPPPSSSATSSRSSTKIPSFQSYITDDKDRDDDSGESPSISPQERRKSGSNTKLKAREVLLENESSTKVDVGRESSLRRVSSSGESDSMGELLSSTHHGGGFGSGGVSMRSTSYGHGGRSDSFGRNMRPGYPLRRHNSNESVSSQSTLVPRVPFYEAEDTYGIVDMIRPETERGGLTQSRINALQRSEDRKHRYGGAPTSYRRLHPDVYDYGDKLRGKEQRMGRGSSGQETPDDEDSQLDTRKMQVSPGGDQPDVHIASDSELQNVIEFLSKSRPEGSNFENSQYDSSSGAGNHRGDRNSKEYPYPPFSSYNSPGYHRDQWSRGGGGGGGGGDHPSVVGSGVRGDSHDRNPTQSSDNSSSGSSGIGMDDPYGRVRHDAHRSRSSSMSPGPENDPRGSGPGRLRSEQDNEQMVYLGSSKFKDVGSMDSGIHVHGLSMRKKGRQLSDGGVEVRERDNKRQSQEIPLDFSKGFGPLITSEPERFGMDMLRKGEDYKLGLELYKNMSDSDSDNNSGFSGRESRDSIPNVSSSSSGSQSPGLLRTRSAENICTTERSASRTSTHSMPYTVNHGSAVSLDELTSGVDFNHAPGSRLPQHRGGHPYSDYEYDDHHLSHVSLEGSGRGSLSQGSHDIPPWDWGHEHQMRSRPREQFDYRGPYDYDGPPPPHRPPVSGPYEQQVMHERQSRSLQRNPIGRSHDDYSPSPGPPPSFDHRHPMMPPPYGHGGYEPSFEPTTPRMRSNSRGPPLPPSTGPGPMPLPPGGPAPGHGGPLPLHHPMNENRFRPVAFRSNTPSDAPSPASMPSMSPGPSPHPTPPPTPPPNPNLMGPGPPHPHGPAPPPFPGPPHMHNQGPPGGMPPHMGGPMPPGHPPHPHLGPLRPGLPPHHGPPPRLWETGPGPGPGMGLQRDFPPPPPPSGPRGMPPPLGHAPSPGPPPTGVGSGPRYPNHPAEWERNWKHH